MARDKDFIPEEKIAKALDVFWEKGYNATSMQDLVEAMQINRSSLYNSFGKGLRIGPHPEGTVSAGNDGKDYRRLRSRYRL